MTDEEALQRVLSKKSLLDKVMATYGNSKTVKQPNTGKGLTSKQLSLFRYISAYIERNEIAPSFDEMKDALGLKSKSGVHRLVTSLEERGYIVRLKDRARGITIRGFE